MCRGRKRPVVETEGLFVCYLLESNSAEDYDEADVFPDVAALESKCILDVFSMTELEMIRQVRQRSPAAARLYLALNSQIAFQQIQPPAVRINLAFRHCV